MLWCSTILLGALVLRNRQWDGMWQHGQLQQQTLVFAIHKCEVCEGGIDVAAAYGASQGT